MGKCSLRRVAGPEPDEVTPLPLFPTTYNRHRWFPLLLALNTPQYWPIGARLNLAYLAAVTIYDKPSAIMSKRVLICGAHDISSSFRLSLISVDV